jgi:hypothetical protein
MKIVRLICTTGALVAALGVLVISLSTVSSVQSSSGSTGFASKEFYLEGDVLPDHMAYMIVMTIDRIRLESSTPTDRVYLKTEYANRRLKYAQLLIEKDDFDLAVTTLTKAQKYLLSAGSDVVQLEMPVVINKHVLATTHYHLTQLDEFSDQLSDQQRAVIDGLDEEYDVLIEQLESRL